MCDVEGGVRKSFLQSNCRNPVGVVKELASYDSIEEALAPNGETRDITTE